MSGEGGEEVWSGQWSSGEGGEVSQGAGGSDAERRVNLTVIGPPSMIAL